MKNIKPFKFELPKIDCNSEGIFNGTIEIECSNNKWAISATISAEKIISYQKGDWFTPPFADLEEVIVNIWDWNITNELGEEVELGLNDEVNFETELKEEIEFNIKNRI